jgi:hypothetical protein
MLIDLVAFFLLGLPITNEGSVVVEGQPPPRPAPVQRAPGMKANPTWICPDGTSNPPNLC